MSFDLLRKELAAVALAKNTNCAGPLPKECCLTDLDRGQWCGWCRTQRPAKRSSGFRDQAHTTDKVTVELIRD